MISVPKSVPGRISSKPPILTIGVRFMKIGISLLKLRAKDNKYNMRKSLILPFIGLLFLMAGCIPSVHPLYTEQDLIFDSSLIGEWVNQDGNESWTFTKSAGKEYKLVYMDKDARKGEFVVHLLKVDDRRFLDLYPVSPDLKENDFYKGHLLPVHTFMRVEQIEPTFQMAILKLDWLKKFLQENPGAIRHEKVDDSILLTADPKELQGFLMMHEKTADAWEECDSMSRRVEKTKQ